MRILLFAQDARAEASGLRCARNTSSISRNAVRINPKQTPQRLTKAKADGSIEKKTRKHKQYSRMKSSDESSPGPCRGSRAFVCSGRHARFVLYLCYKPTGPVPYSLSRGTCYHHARPSFYSRRLLE